LKPPEPKNAKRFLKASPKAHFPAVLHAVAEGASVRDALNKFNVAWVSFFRYLERSPEHWNAYARARQMRVEKWIDEMVPMSDAVIGKEMSVVTATRNAIDVRKWVASRLMPREYGDQPSGVTINNQTNVMVMSEERLRHLQATRRRMMLEQGTREV
jgi:hypothetical protein